MHAGGVHLVFGLLFLVLSIIWVSLTIYCVYVFVAILDRGYQKYRRYVITQDWIDGTSPSPDEVLTRPPLPYWSLAFLLNTLRMISVLFVIAYGGQRYKWMGGENRHYEAKEYWVAGQPLSGFRKAVAFVLHPDNPLTRHLTFLQQVIYDRGISYLPEGDGESGVWKIQWFFRPYIEKITLTYGTTVFDPTPPRMIRLLDEAWAALEAMGNGSFDDSAMQRMYYKQFPLLAMYYETLETCYMGKQVGTLDALLRDPFHVNRKHRLLFWLDNLETDWKITGFLQSAWEHDTMIVATLIDTSMTIRQELLSQMAFSGTFSCDDPVITALYHQYVAIMTDDPDVSIAVKLTQERLRTSVTLYRDLVHTMRGDLGRFVLKEFCHKNFPDENSVLRGGCFSSLPMNVSSYSDDIKLIKQKMNE
ncbi:hypothetical protein [Desulfoluna limicola]|uniref:hypothetical protein n=1 Tax=Desulfoluna limicola TaxID=2810562 RepID=UPI001F290A38|nr:hypothetical protein [Desulfoluna limicola]